MKRFALLLAATAALVLPASVAGAAPADTSGALPDQACFAVIHPSYVLEVLCGK
ncbi:MAG: hypothetical protein ACRDY7_08575 [Acidimicrobiia bacterium]